MTGQSRFGIRRWWIAVCCVVATAVIALGVLVLQFRASLLPPIADWLDVGKPAARADYVMILPGDAQRRPFVAAALVNVGLADRILITKTRISPDVEDGVRPPSHEISRRVLVCRGVPKDRIIVLEGSSGSTADEARLLSEFLASHADARVAVVTNAFHSRRARWTLARHLKDRMRRVSLVSAPNPGFRSDNWWTRPGGFYYVTSEYAKLAYYSVRYGNILLGAATLSLFAIGGLAWRGLAKRKGRQRVRQSVCQSLSQT